MERLLVSSSGFIFTTLVSGTPQLFPVPMRLANKKVALLKKVVLEIWPLQVLSDIMSVGAVLLSRPMRIANVNVAATALANIDAMYRSPAFVVGVNREFRFGSAVGFAELFQPIVLDLPEPYMVVQNDLTLVVDGGNGGAAFSATVYYVQKQVSSEEWVKLAKEY